MRVNVEGDEVLKRDGTMVLREGKGREGAIHPGRPPCHTVHMAQVSSPHHRVPSAVNVAKRSTEEWYKFHSTNPMKIRIYAVLTYLDLRIQILEACFGI